MQAREDSPTSSDSSETVVYQSEETEKKRKSARTVRNGVDRRAKSTYRSV